MTEDSLQCFIIMPFGDKRGDSGLAIAFDRVYQSLIKPAVIAAGLEPKRADEIMGGELIAAKMVQAIADAPFALVDATFLNPNVYYEFGVRHALRRSGTIAMREARTPIPFDVRDIPFFTYDLNDQGDVKDPQTAIEALTAHIRACRRTVVIDNPVWTHLRSLRVDVSRDVTIEHSTAVRYRLAADDRFAIGLWTGDIMHVREVDAWVNSENTHMQMARVWDRSISSMIRYWGAQRDDGGEVIRDLIVEQLRKKVRARIGSRPRVDIGSVFDTVAGQLTGSHNVKRIFHVASVEGSPGRGFRATEDVRLLVERTLLAADAYNRRTFVRRDRVVKSLLFPLFGVGTGNVHPEVVTDQMIGGAMQTLETLGARRPPTKLAEVYFLARTRRNQATLERTFAKLVNDGRLTLDRPGA